MERLSPRRRWPTIVPRAADCSSAIVCGGESGVLSWSIGTWCRLWGSGSGRSSSRRTRSLTRTPGDILFIGGSLLGGWKYNRLYRSRRPAHITVFLCSATNGGDNYLRVQRLAWCTSPIITAMHPLKRSKPRSLAWSPVLTRSQID